MTGDDIGRIIYLVLLGCVVGSYFLVANRENLGAMARGAILWVLIFLGAIVGVGLWMDVKDQVLPSVTTSADGSVIEVPRSSDGHFYLTLSIEDIAVEFVVDTGATDVVLSLQDAARIGIDTENLIYTGRAFTANGEVRTADVRLRDVTVDGIDEGNLRASVNEGDLNTSLLGMAYLNRFDSIEIRGNRLRLSR